MIGRNWDKPLSVGEYYSWTCDQIALYHGFGSWGRLMDVVKTCATVFDEGHKSYVRACYLLQTPLAQALL